MTRMAARLPFDAGLDEHGLLVVLERLATLITS
jgi:hypothetical protein